MYVMKSRTTDNASSNCVGPPRSSFFVLKVLETFSGLLVREGVFKLENFTRTELNNIIAVMSNESRPITT